MIPIPKQYIPEYLIELKRGRDDLIAQWPEPITKEQKSYLEGADEKILFFEQLLNPSFIIPSVEKEKKVKKDKIKKKK